MAPISPKSHYAQELFSSCISGLPSFGEPKSPTCLLSPKHDEPGMKYTQPPNPSWGWGDKTESTPLGKKWMDGADQEDAWEHVDTNKSNLMEMYTLLMNGVQPRPIAFISSMSEDGVENLAPFSFFQAVCPWPPLIMFSALNKPRVKDTTVNVQGTKGFTVNMISTPWIEQANLASIETPEHISEWEMTGLTKEPSTFVHAPRVKESAFSLECTFFSKYDVVHPDSTTGVPTATIIYGLIKCIHMRKSVLNAQGVPDPSKYMVVSRLGDISYGLTTKAFKLPRPNWRVDGDEIESALSAEKNKELEDRDEITMFKERKKERSTVSNGVASM